MNIAVTGSIARDYLMSFSGHFKELIVAEQLERLSLSFLVDDLEVRRGGVGANISFGIAQLGLRPVLVATVGDDFGDYRAWLEGHGVDTGSVRDFSDLHTARFHCTTDADQNQIASFYPGAMAAARDIDLESVAGRVGGIDTVVVSPNDPEAMLRHTREANDLGLEVVADPSQQLASMDGDVIRELVDGAAMLVTNDYERSLLESKTGWGPEEVLARVGVRITTHGAKGCVIERLEAPTIEVPAVATTHIDDPTGVGDGFRAGLLAGRTWGLELQRAAQVGCTLATYALECAGPQDYEIDRGAFLHRLATTYGDTAAEEIAPHLREPTT